MITLTERVMKYLRFNGIVTLAEKGGSNAGESTVYYNAAIRYLITASSQKINHNQDQRQPTIAVRSMYTITAGTHNQ